MRFFTDIITISMLCMIAPSCITMAAEQRKGDNSEYTSAHTDLLDVCDVLEGLSLGNEDKSLKASIYGGKPRIIRLHTIHSGRSDYSMLSDIIRSSFRVIIMGRI